MTHAVAHVETGFRPHRPSYELMFRGFLGFAIIACALVGAAAHQLGFSFPTEYQFAVAGIGGIIGAAIAYRVSTRAALGR